MYIGKRLTHHRYISHQLAINNLCQQAIKHYYISAITDSKQKKHCCLTIIVNYLVIKSKHFQWLKFQCRPYPLYLAYSVGRALWRFVNLFSPAPRIDSQHARRPRLHCRAIRNALRQNPARWLAEPPADVPIYPYDTFENIRIIILGISCVCFFCWVVGCYVKIPILDTVEYKSYVKGCVFEDSITVIVPSHEYLIFLRIDAEIYL